MKPPIEIYSEFTPNPNAIRFVTNMALSPGKDYHFESAEDAAPSEIASKLFTFPFVKSVFISESAITVVAIDDIDWLDIVRQVREFIKETLEKSDSPIIEPSLAHQSDADDLFTDSHVETKDQLEKKIIETLDEYIKPAVERDGGAIYFRGFDDGIVKVALRGACSGCPSSTLTLKAGVENLLKAHFPEKVNQVVAI